MSIGHPQKLLAAVGFVLSMVVSSHARGQSGIAPQPPQADLQPASERVLALVAEAERYRKALRFDEASSRADEAITEAARTGDGAGLTAAHRVRGAILISSGRPQEAGPWVERALAEAESAGDRHGVAAALVGLIQVATQLGDSEQVNSVGIRAIRLLTELGDERTRAAVVVNLVRIDESASQDDPRILDALETAGRLDDDSLRGTALRTRGSKQFSRGDLAGAQRSYEAAAVALESAGDLAAVAAVHLSLGRILRAHGDYEGALKEYGRAIDILSPTSERSTIVEAVNATGVALGLLNRHAEAVGAYERGLALARESGNPRLIDFMTGNLAGAFLDLKDYARALPVLQDILARKPEPYLAGFRYHGLAVTLAGLGRPAEALEAIDESIRITKELKQIEPLGPRLRERSKILRGLGRFEEALADVREGLTVADQMRSRLVPLDFLKRGYAEGIQSLYAQGVDLLARLGRGSDALELSEAGRSRAFVDLLASREADGPALSTRGAPAVKADTGLSSGVTVQPVSLDTMRQLATRLGSTVVTYWTGDEGTQIWVLHPDGTLRHTRASVTRERLAGLVAATTAILRVPSAVPPTRGREAPAVSMPLRGLGLLALSRDDRTAWRELYTLLITPVRTSLPARGARLTIVPHGPLFRLSFAALQNEAGRYLLEDFELHYAPSISALEFTGRRQQVLASADAGPWALVGDPGSYPLVDERPLAPLPGAGRELTSIGGVAPGGRVVRLAGVKATESALVRALDTARPSVLHFATHGLVFDDPKQPPFLALHRSGETSDADGRLTLDEVYRLRVEADLVVLSACRTGSGPLSSDGIEGLVRGFFYAGTPTVVATFWDVTDEATTALMSRFYRSYARARAKSASLRSAQLALLAGLRAGQVSATVLNRSITLPEHPLLWAGFFLSGEP